MGKFRINSPDRQRVGLELEGEDGRTVSLSLSPKEAALMAAAILELCRELPSTESQASVRRGGDWPVVRASRVSLGPSPLPDCESMVLGFGDAHLAVALRRDLLRPIGESLVRMSMGETNR
jgi:hypothetical protein